MKWLASILALLASCALSLRSTVLHLVEAVRGEDERPSAVLAPPPTEQVPDPARKTWDVALLPERELARAAASIPPPGPADEGLVEALTRRHVPDGDRAAFYLAIRSNRAVESGERARFSALRTTAGPRHRASFGVAQLTIRCHVEELLGLSDADLRALDVTRSELAEMRRRGDAAVAWYRVVAEGHVGSASRAGLSDHEARGAVEAAADGHRLIERFGASFTAGTGLPATALPEIAATRSLRDDGIRRAYARARGREAGAAIDHGPGDGLRAREAVEWLARRDPHLARSWEQLGGDAAATTALVHYLGVGDVAENLHGWYARAAEGAVGRARYVRILEVADPVSTRLREIANFVHATAVVDLISDLRGTERARMLARIGRCFHGAPARARRAFFFGGDLARPRAVTAAELEAALQEYRRSRGWSDARIQDALDDLIAGEAR